MICAPIFILVPISQNISIMGMPANINKQQNPRCLPQGWCGLSIFVNMQYLTEAITTTTKHKFIRSIIISFFKRPTYLHQDSLICIYGHVSTSSYMRFIASDGANDERTAVQTDAGRDEKLMSPRRSPHKSEQSTGKVTEQTVIETLSQHR